jgi:signal transduction histidine kinase
VVGILAITSSGALHESLAMSQLHTPGGALLYILVAVLTTALQARLRRAHQRADAARAMAARRSGRLRALQDAALTIAAPVSAEPAAVAALLTRIIDGAVASVGGCDGSFVLADDRAWAGLVPGTASGEGPVWLAPSGQLERAPLRPGGATARVLAGGPAVVVPDTLAPPARGAYEALAREGVRSFAVVPLRAGGRVLGALSVSFANHGAALEETHETLELFAAHAAAALERVRWADETARQAAALAQREAEAAGWRELDRMKDEFLLTISHELRTPLTVIYGDAARLEARARALDPAAVQASAARIRSSSDRLTRLVRDLLDFARIDQGEIQVRPQPVDLAPLLHEVAAAWRREPMGERLVCDLPASLPAVADPQRVAQVVSNLIVNALKYAPDGPVLLRARLVGGGSTVRVVVADEGPGIMPGEQSRVWEKFFRGAGVAGLNRVPGAGIGLSVVKALIEAQDGRVGLDSAPGQGCCFWF